MQSLNLRIRREDEREQAKRFGVQKKKSCKIKDVKNCFFVLDKENIKMQ